MNFEEATISSVLVREFEPPIAGRSAVVAANDSNAAAARFDGVGIINVIRRCCLEDGERCAVPSRLRVVVTIKCGVVDGLRTRCCCGCEEQANRYETAHKPNETELSHRWRQRALL